MDANFEEATQTRPEIRVHSLHSRFNNLRLGRRMADADCGFNRLEHDRKRVDTTAAILLRKTKLTETSLIVTWLSEAHGRLKTVAKGARAPKSRFAGVLDLFFECEIQFIRSRKSELHALREAALVEPHEGLRLDYKRVALAAYFVELIELVTEPDHPSPELFDLLKRGLGFLNAHPATARALLHFEAELVRLLGIQGQQGVTPAVAIGRVYHRLPSARPALLKTLK